MKPKIKQINIGHRFPIQIKGAAYQYNQKDYMAQNKNCKDNGRFKRSNLK